MGARKSPVKVARQEFGITPEEPYYWVRLLQPVHNETLAEYLDTEEVRYSPAEFPGLLYQPLFGDETFVFVNRGSFLVDLTSATAEEAKNSIDDLLKTLVERGVLDKTGHTEIEAASAEQVSTDSVATAGEVDGIDLTAAFQNAKQSIVRRPLFNPRDRLVVPDSGLVLLFNDLAGGERIRYEYADDRGFLELTAAPDGATFAGIDTDDRIGFVFTPDRLRYQFETPDSRFCSVSNSGAMILGTSFTDATVVVYDETGTQRFETDVASIDGVTISPDGRQFGYAGHVVELNQEVVVLCDRLDDGTVEQTTVTDYASVEYDPERGGFRVAEQSKDVFTALLAPDGTVIEEYDYETSRGNVNELLTRLEKQSTEDDDIVADISVAVQEEPALFASHVPSFVKRLVDNEFPQRQTTNVPRLFRTLAEETPSAFEPTLDQLFALLERPDMGYQSESAIAVLQPLLGNGMAQERIVERLHRLVATDDEDRQRRALQALQGIPAGDLVGYEGILDQLLELLDREMPPKIMLPVTAVLSVHQRREGSQAITDSIVAAQKIDVLVALLQYWHNRREDVIEPGLTFTIDGSEMGSEEPVERNVALGGAEVYHLNQRVATLLSTVASRRPDALVPHFGHLLLDVKTEGESMEVFRKNAVDIVETLVKQDLDGLEVAAERNADLIVDLLNHDETRVGTLGVRLAALAGTERTQQEIQQIAETPSHQLWNDATDVLDQIGSDTDSDRGPPDGSSGDSDTVLEPLTRVAQLPVNPKVVLSVPRPEDIERYREDANKERSDIERRGEEAQRIHRSYIAALENGAVSPRLSVLADVVFATTPDENVTVAFPTGPRIRARREGLDVPRSELAEQAGCSDNRLQAIETNQTNPQAHELERIVAHSKGETWRDCIQYETLSVRPG
jgi:predicted transcriptional regulator